jgi:hypothetical protein
MSRLPGSSHSSGRVPVPAAMIGRREPRRVALVELWPTLHRLISRLARVGSPVPSGSPIAYEGRTDRPHLQAGTAQRLAGRPADVPRRRHELEPGHVPNGHLTLRGADAVRRGSQPRAGVALPGWRWLRRPAIGSASSTGSLVKSVPKSYPGTGTAAKTVLTPIARGEGRG